MALTVTSLTAGGSTGADPDTASVSPAGGSLILLGVTVACSTFLDPPTDAMAPSGVCSGGWTQLATHRYTNGRRRIWLFRGVADGTGAITLTYSGGGTYQETQWTVDEVTGFDTGTPTDTAVVGDASSTFINSPDVGTPGTGDFTYAVATHEDDEAMSAKSGCTLASAYNPGGGSPNVRAVCSVYDGDATPDEQPGATWTTSGRALVIGCIINVAAGGGLSIPVAMANYRRQHLGAMH